jgi:hypothetical protein
VFPHVFAPWVKVLDLGFPKRVVTLGGLYHSKDWREIPDFVHTCIDYEGGPTVSLLGTTASSREGPMMVRGQKAAMIVRDPTEVEIIPEEAAGVGKPRVLKGKEPLVLFDHWRGFLKGVRTRRKPIHDETFGYRVMVAIAMGVKSYRSGKALGFDPEQGTVKEL